MELNLNLLQEEHVLFTNEIFLQIHDIHFEKKISWYSLRKCDSLSTSSCYVFSGLFSMGWIEFLVSISFGCLLCVCVSLCVHACVYVCVLVLCVCVYVFVLVSIWMHISQHTCGQPQMSVFAFLCWLLHMPGELVSCFWVFSYQHLPSEISITGITYSPYNTQPSVASEDVHLCSKCFIAWVIALHDI